MPAPDDLDQRAVEDFLAGRSAGAVAGPLALFAEDLRVAVSGPAPAPTPHLARLLAEGLSLENREAPAIAGSAQPAAPETADRSRRIRKMTISELLTALAAKLGGLGLAAKAALGLGLATATAATVGAAGALPAPAQHAVATVVNATPLHIPDGTDDDDATATVTDSNGTTPPAVNDPATTGDGTDVGTGAGAGTAGQPTDTHGACVSAVAQNAPKGPGGVHGDAVSAAAQTCPKGAEADDEATTTTTSTTIASGGAAELSGQDHGQSGQDHGQSGQDHGQSGQDHGGQTGQDRGGSGQHGR